MGKKKNDSWTRIVLTLLLIVCFGITLSAQNPTQTGISGKVYELDSQRKRIPLEFATIYLPDYGMGATTTDNGLFSLDNVPTGKTRMQVQFVGKLPIDTLVNVSRNMKLDFTLKNEDFKLEEVVVTATNSQAGKSTASHISRQAMDHLQATSLNDLLALMPGGLSQNSDLSTSQQINIRQIAGNNWRIDSG